MCTADRGPEVPIWEAWDLPDRPRETPSRDLTAKIAGPTKATRPDPLPFVSGSCWTGTERSTLATARSLAAPDRGGPARATWRRTRPARPREAHFTHPRHSAALAAGDNAKTGLNRDSSGLLPTLPHRRMAAPAPPDAMRPRSGAEPRIVRQWPLAEDADAGRRRTPVG
jgi:hypothetical protein